MKQLSEKQIQILQLLSDGSTQKEIAGKIGQSPRTVEKILRQLRISLGCVSNEQLTKKALILKAIQ